MFKKSLLGIILAFAVAAPAIAQQAAPAAPAATSVRVRGTVQALNGDTLVVKTREGPTINIAMQPNWMVQSVIPVKLEEIKPGDFVGASAVKRADGKMVAEAIHYLDAANRERAQGDIPWDLTPQSLMINADLGQVVRAANGEMTVKMTHNKATYDMVVTPQTPIVKYAPGDKALLKPGAAVFMTAQKQPDGTYTGTNVRAETNGVKPPL